MKCTAHSPLSPSDDVEGANTGTASMPNSMYITSEPAPLRAPSAPPATSTANVWPVPCNPVKSPATDDDTGKEAYISLACVSSPTVNSSHTGPVIQLEFVCQEIGQSQLTLLSVTDDPVNGTMLIDAGGAQAEPFLTHASVNCTAADKDSDGMPDYCEDDVAHACTDANVSDATDDDDSDGLTHLEEFNAGTKPCDNDTDDDGLLDGEEIDTYFTDPPDEDTDGDGPNDFEEINSYVTDPTDTDRADHRATDAIEAPPAPRQP